MAAVGRVDTDVGFISYLVSQLSEQHGLGTYLHFIRRLIVHSQGRLSAGSNTPFDASNALTFRLLVQEAQRLARDPFLADPTISGTSLRSSRLLVS